MNLRAVLVRIVAPALLFTPVVTLTATAHPALATTINLQTAAGQIVSGISVPSGSPNDCLDNTGAVEPASGSSNPVEIYGCNGNYGSQLWTTETDSTIRIN